MEADEEQRIEKWARQRLERDRIKRANVFKRARKTCPLCRSRMRPSGIIGNFHCGNCGAFYGLKGELHKEGNPVKIVEKEYFQETF